MCVPRMNGVDEASLDAARNGNRQAQARLLTDLQDIWFRFSYSVLRNHDLAADATQETGLRFLRALPTFKGQSELRTWSLGIALNVAREMQRKQRRPDPPAVLDFGSPASQGAQVAEVRDQIRSVLAQLPERQREAITLRFFEDLSTDQTAAAMGCAAGTVKATLHQA